MEIQNVDADGEKPSFIPTPDVVKALIREGVLTGAPSGKRDFAAMQTAFNAWSEQSNWT